MDRYTEVFPTHTINTEPSSPVVGAYIHLKIIEDFGLLLFWFGFFLIIALFVGMLLIVCIFSFRFSSDFSPSGK